MKTNERLPGKLAAAAATILIVLLSGAPDVIAQEPAGAPSPMDESDDEARDDDRAPCHEDDRNEDARTEPREEFPDSVPGGDASLSTEEDDIANPGASVSSPSTITEDDDKGVPVAPDDTEVSAPLDEAPPDAEEIPDIDD
jgi:hypothetical protein